MSLIDDPVSLRAEIASRAKARRLALALTQEGLSNRSGVNLSSLRVFERTGKISLQNLLQIALVLGALEGFKFLFAERPEQSQSLDELLRPSRRRKRGSIK